MSSGRCGRDADSSGAPFGPPPSRLSLPNADMIDDRDEDDEDEDGEAAAAARARRNSAKVVASTAESTMRLKKSSTRVARPPNALRHTARTDFSVASSGRFSM